MTDTCLTVVPGTGLWETSIDQIAEAAEVSPSTFFRYFPTKEDVVLADDVDPILLKAFDDQPRDLPPLEALREAITATYRALTPEDMGREQERQQLLLSVPELRQAIIAQLYHSIDIIAKATAERLGRSADDFEVRVFAGAVTGAILGAAGGPDGSIDGAIRAVEFLEKGLPLS